MLYSVYSPIQLFPLCKIDHRDGQCLGSRGPGVHSVSQLHTSVQGPMEVLGGAKEHLFDIFTHLKQAGEF